MSSLSGNSCAEEDGGSSSNAAQNSWAARQRVDDEDSGHQVLSGCCAGLSRGVAVAGALGVVMAILVGVGVMIFDAAYRLKANFAIYEQGAQNAVAEVKDLFCMSSARCLLTSWTSSGTTL